jgi:hypothetical protein
MLFRITKGGISDIEDSKGGGSCDLNVTDPVPVIFVVEKDGYSSLYPHIKFKIIFKVTGGPMEIWDVEFSKNNR